MLVYAIIFLVLGIPIAKFLISKYGWEYKRTVGRVLVVSFLLILLVGIIGSSLEK
jgi:hypothetical protein